MIINHNIAALNTYRQLSSNNVLANKSLEKLSSGLRIVRAGDDAAGLAISEKMRGQIRGLNQAVRNSQDAISLIQTAEGALNETHSILQRMRELAVQAASDTNVTVDRAEIQKEINQLTSEINRIGNTTQFNTMTLMRGDWKDTRVTLKYGAAVTGGSGINLSLAVADSGAMINALTAGAHTISVTKIASSGQVGTFHAAVADFSGAAVSKLTFSGNGIRAGSGAAGLNTSGRLYFAISGGKVYFGLSGKTPDVSFIDEVAIGTAYNNHGYSFKITSGVLSGTDTMSKRLNGVSAGTLSTKQVGFVTSIKANKMSGNFTFTGLVQGDQFYLYKSGNVMVLTNSGSTGNYELFKDVLFSGNFGGAFAKTVTSYSNHGINLSNVRFSGSGNSSFSGNIYMKFNLTNDGIVTSLPDYYKVFLDGNSGAGVKLAYNAEAINGLISGAKIDVITSSGSSVLQTGTYNFNFNYSTRVSGADNSLKFQIGANENQALFLQLEDMRAVALRISSTAAGGAFTAEKNVTNGTDATAVEYALDVSTHEKAAQAVTIIDNAIQAVSAERSKLGANQNRLEHTINNLGTASENLSAAESRIRDVDMAKEMMEFTKMSILQQAATAMLAQANRQPETVLQLLR